MVKTKDSPKLTKNPCSSCGKERVVIKTYKEYVGNSLVINTLTACPDPDCQSRIDTQLAKEERFRAEMKLASARRLLEQKERRAESLKKAL
ncbi:MAG: hypothetical protein AAB875_01585 [Patescibacteria group bacterium]